MMALIDHERVAPDRRRVELVGAEQPEQVDPAAQHAREVLAAWSRHEAEIERADPAAAVCSTLNPCHSAVIAADARRQRPGRREHGRAVRPPQRPLPHDDHRPLGSRSTVREIARARAAPRGPSPSTLHVIGRLRQRARPSPIGQPPSSQRLRMRAFSTGASRRGLLPTSRIASASSIPAIARVEQVELAPRRIERRAVLPAVEIGRAERRHEVLQRQHALRVAQVAGDRADPLARQALQPVRDRLERLRPGRRPQLARRAAPTACPAAAASARPSRSATCRPATPRSRPRWCAAGCASPRSRGCRPGSPSPARRARRCCRSCGTPTAAP